MTDLVLILFKKFYISLRFTQVFVFEEWCKCTFKKYQEKKNFWRLQDH